MEWGCVQSLDFRGVCGMAKELSDLGIVLYRWPRSLRGVLQGTVILTRFNAQCSYCILRLFRASFLRIYAVDAA
jgi:hypothetical protein